MKEDIQTGETCVTLATAHPAKLKPLMERIIEQPIQLPRQLSKHLKGNLKVQPMNNGFTSFKRLLLSNN